MRKKNTIIIAICCCNDDMENQIVYKLATTIDKEGVRTIGVLTKPDLIEPTSVDKWVEVLQNETE